MVNLSYNGKSFNQREGDGYVCVSEMCSNFGKRFGHWKQLNSSQAYIAALSKSHVNSETGHRRDHGDGSLIVQTSKGRNGTETWCHPLIAIEVARWISPEFAVWANQHIKTLIESGSTSLQQAVAITPKTFSEALYLAAQIQEEKELLEAEVAVLEAENHRLAEEVDELYGWSSIIRVAKHNGLEESQFKWHRLKAASEKCGDEIKKAPCPRFGYKNLYSHNAWRLAYPGIELPENSVLAVINP